MPNANIMALALVDLKDWTTAYDKSIALVAAMSNSDKVLLVTGQDVPSFNFTALRMNDGFQGIENYFYVSAFLESSAIAQTWNKDLVKSQFHAVGQEFRGKGYNLINGPTTNPQGRTPWSGRLVETLGQDSYLACINFGLAVEGLRAAGIIPCGKHFLLNEQETNRSEAYWGNNAVTYPRNNTAYSSNADGKTIHKTYLWPFYDGVKSGLGAIMCAMKRVNGS